MASALAMLSLLQPAACIFAAEAGTVVKAMAAIAAVGSTSCRKMFFMLFVPLSDRLDAIAESSRQDLFGAFPPQ
jgi:hypothetical protein